MPWKWSRAHSFANYCQAMLIIIVFGETSTLTFHLFAATLVLFFHRTYWRNLCMHISISSHSPFAAFHSPIFTFIICIHTRQQRIDTRIQKVEKCKTVQEENEIQLIYLANSCRWWRNGYNSAVCSTYVCTRLFLVASHNFDFVLLRCFNDFVLCIRTKRVCASTKCTPKDF